MDVVYPEEVKMQKRVLMLTMSVFILACGAVAVSAQQGTMMQHQPQVPQQQQEQQYHRGMGMMGRGGMMGVGGTHSTMMRVLFAMMDSDGDGTVSLQEFQAAHERISRCSRR